MIRVCSISKLQEVVNSSGARHVVSLVRDDDLISRERILLEKSGFDIANHLWLQMDDIPDLMDGMIAPGAEHVEKLVDFATRWDRNAPMVVHCYAGISRSTAAAFIAACAISPEASEREIAANLRNASPTAMPNRRLVKLGDDFLGRKGRMVEAVGLIGDPVVAAYEAAPSELKWK
jgi:predicted protein tyrosine phosphatase